MSARNSDAGSSAPEIAVVTGGASGIGAAVAGKLAGQGLKVVAADLRAGAPVAGVHHEQCDVRQEDEVARVVERAAALGPVSVLVNSAAVGGRSPFDEVALDDWNRMLAVNLTGTALFIKHAIPQLRRRGGGSIVNIASVGASMTTAKHNGPYAASKGAVVGLTRALVYELAEQGIRVNAVAPGYTDTPLIAGRGERWRTRSESRIPMGRLASPAEIAEVVAFLAGNASSYVNGHVLTADGGLTAAVFASDRAAT